MTPDVLLRIKTAWEKETINDDRVILWAAFTLCFFSFMRSGEIGANSESDFDPTCNLTTQDVAIDNLTNPQILKIRLKCSKTDPFREGSDIFLARTHDELCPVTAMLAWLVKRKAKPAAEGPLFVLQAGAPLTRNSFVAHFKEALMAAHIDPIGFSGYSFRIGAATTASRQGLPESIIKRLGRWKSTVYQRYIKPPTTHLASLASSISAQGQSHSSNHSHGMPSSEVD